jgi:hypothetical protein
MTTKYTYQNAIKYYSIFHCKTLQNVPKLGFLVRNCTIWHPCPSPSRLLFFHPDALLLFLLLPLGLLQLLPDLVADSRIPTVRPGSDFLGGGLRLFGQFLDLAALLELKEG